MKSTSEELSTLLSSATLVFVGTVVGVVARLGERIILGRALATDVYGDVTIALAIVSIGSTLAGLGLTQGVPRYMSRFDDPGDVRGVVVTGFVVALSGATVVAALLWLNLGWLASALFETPGAMVFLLPFILTIPFQVGMKISIGGIRGLENTLYKTLVGDLFFPFGRIALLGLLLWAGYGVAAAGYAYLIAASTSFVLALWLLNRLFTLVGQFRTRTREMIAFSVPLIIAAVLNILLTRTDTVMIGYFDSSFATGLYGYAYPLATGLLLVVASFGFLYLPLASRFDANDRHEELDAVYKITTKWAFVATFPAFLTFVMFPGDVLAIFFSDRARPAALAFVVLAGGFFTNAAFGRNRETLSALGQTKVIMVANGFAYVLNVCLNLLLIPLYSYLGAAVASGISYVSLNLVIYLVLRRRFDISPFSRWTRRTFVALPAVLGVPAYLLSQWLTLSYSTLPLVLVGTALASVVVVAATGCLQPEDEIVITVFEDAVGVELTVLRRILPLPSD
jgi:O-antigen/teichoic acid export membrane protein